MLYQVAPSAHIELWILLLLNIAYLSAIYFGTKYFYRFLDNKRFRSRYKLALVFLLIGLIQSSSLLGYAIIPAYILFIAYFYTFGLLLLKLFDIFFIDQKISWAIWVMITLFQIPVYALLGFLLGIFHEHYGTESK